MGKILKTEGYEIKNFLKFYNGSITYENKPLTNLYFI